MTDVLVTRVARDEHVRLESAGLACEDGKCFELHRVRWAESLLSEDGRREICRFVAPDAESVRMALRKLDGEISSVWASVRPRIHTRIIDGLMITRMSFRSMVLKRSSSAVPGVTSQW